ncbi:hypothetical protein [Halomicronema sp. CCY15110]|uniref:hypothetical protein n=1 Tax=Halomicronema sp. CCY15110 TaxID=2767773 RepID=UPI00195204E2|nr:hypothetical protein [Halomicronema sp. CCY15110]
MNNTPSDNSHHFEDELLDEYRFDYTKAKPNRFAAQENTAKRTGVVLDDDVAQVLTTPESVNRVLRALIESMPRSADGETA